MINILVIQFGSVLVALAEILNITQLNFISLVILCFFF